VDEFHREACFVHASVDRCPQLGPGDADCHPKPTPSGAAHAAQMAAQRLTGSAALTQAGFQEAPAGLSEVQAANNHDAGFRAGAVAVPAGALDLGSSCCSQPQPQPCPGALLHHQQQQHMNVTGAKAFPSTPAALALAEAGRGAGPATVGQEQHSPRDAVSSGAGGVAPDVLRLPGAEVGAGVAAGSGIALQCRTLCHQPPTTLTAQGHWQHVMVQLLRICRWWLLQLQCQACLGRQWCHLLLLQLPRLWMQLLRG